MRFAQRLLASLAAVFVFCLPLSADAAVGRTAGVADVTPTGAASYSIPIVVPPGVNGMAPSLGLSYSSRKDNGVVGVGWSIAGLSTIVRCPRTWAQDGEARDVRLDYSDRFCLDGNKLRLTSGVYGNNAATYRTEIETFSRITSRGTAGNGPENFVVEGKDGLFYYYGVTSDSRIEALGQTTPRAWALNKVLDRAGNYITFTYVEDGTNGSFRISSIAYGGNENQGTVSTHSVSFVYETKPSNEIDAGYIAGSLIKEITRLDRVDVLHGSTVLRRYELSYEPALSSTGKSRLASVQECAGSPLDCLPATTFSYQNGTPGLMANVNTGVAVPTKPWALDVNGDGRTDLVYSSSTTSGGGVWMVMKANPAGGYTTINTGVNNLNYAGAIPIDYNADGAEDLLVPYSGGTWWVMLGNDSTGLAAPVGTGAPATATGTGDNARAMDVNGDGLEDLVWADLTGWAGGDAIRYRLREWGGAFSAAATTLIGPAPVNSMIETNVFKLDSRASRRRTQDFNGDGRPDILYRHSSRTYEEEQQRWIENLTVTAHCVGGAWNINAQDMTGSTRVWFGDFNGDGKTDTLFRTLVANINTVRLSTGKLLKAGFNFFLPTGTLVEAILDWDGDGYDDVLTRHTTNGTLYVLRSTGEGFETGVATGLSTGTANFTVMDVNGDGLPDLGSTVGGVWDYRLHAGVTPDLLQTATDGFGNYTTFNYLPLLNTDYWKYANASYPSQDYQGSLPVVTSTTASNGIGGSYTKSYGYYGARINLQGRGFEGFQSRRSQDSRNSVYTYEYFNRAFPYTGTLYQLEVRQPNNTGRITHVQNTWSAHAYGSGTEAAWLPYISASTATGMEVGGTHNGTQISTSTMTNSVDAATGTPYLTTITITETILANGAQPGATYTQSVHRPTASFANSTASWCIGRPGRIEITGSHDQYGGGAVTRVINETWDTANCRVTQQVVEPDSAQWRVTTNIGYDAFGNVNSETVTGVGMAARTTTLNYGATGRFLQSGTNALAQTTQFGWNASTGTLASVTDPNGIAVSWQYDAFNRRTRETRADNTFTTWQYTDCAPTMCLTSNTKMVVDQSLYATDGNFINQLLLYTDRFERPLAARSLTMSGPYSRVDREYDALGRVSRQSAPCMGAYNCTQYWTTFSYDLLDRVTQVQRPISDSNPTLQSTYTYYEGLTTRSVDALGKQSRHVSNVVGQLARSIDHDGYYQSFDYDGFGNNVRVTDSANNVLMTNVYNVRGMRTSQTDMDAGTWTFIPNALGEVISQTDAKSQTATFDYDLLGRLTTRTELEGVSTFTFGTSAAAKNIGQLASMSGPGYSESFTYDSIGRPSQRTITSDATYQIDYSYNNFGMLETLTYPTSTSGYRLKVRYDYSTTGILMRVRDFNAPSTVFWEANDTDARGAVISETLGNGIQTIRGYDAVTGWLDYIQSGPGGGSSRQDATYQWDQVGNLTQRSEANNSKTENFGYDNLHRLTSWSLVGGTTTSLTYDALGNITSKTGLGTYTYHATRKHQVSSVNGVSYAYDNNGNVTSKDGQPITWYSYNLPKLISGPSSNSSEFFYGPDRSRWKQLASYGGTAETTIYIGGLIEKVTLGSVTSWKHYVSGGTGVVAEVIRRSNGTNETVYLLKDHLGSTEVVTTASGNLLSRLSYNPHGARRNGGSWSGTPASSAWTTITNTTRHGFTGHEMLDNLNLVHMNGRVYDQTIGRFLSADPYVQAPAFTQSFNRYSYVWNNPLSYTDPSGFATTGLREFCQSDCGSTNGGNGSYAGMFFGGGHGGAGLGADGPTPTYGLTYGPTNTGHGHTRPYGDGHIGGGRAGEGGGRTRTTPDFSPSTVNGHMADTIGTVTDAVVPGKYFSYQAVNLWYEGRYVFGTAHFLGMIADVLTAGSGRIVSGGGRTLAVGARTVASAAGTHAADTLRSAMWGARAALLAKSGGGSGGGIGIALGLTDQGLKEFARRLGAYTWDEWYKVGLSKIDLYAQNTGVHTFETVFKSVAGRANSIHFNLKGLNIEALGGSTGSFQIEHGLTVAELLTIVRNPALLKKTTFYIDDKIVSKEEVLRIIDLPGPPAPPGLWWERL